eukprot:8863619-Pyramimonas_sp.AAC.1
MASALQRHWAEVFRAKESPSSDVLHGYMCDHIPVYPVPELRPPSIDDLRTALRKGKPSAPGPDRLPYRAWLAHDEAVETLYLVMLDVFS